MLVSTAVVSIRSASPVMRSARTAWRARRWLIAFHVAGRIAFLELAQRGEVHHGLAVQAREAAQRRAVVDPHDRLSQRETLEHLHEQHAQHVVARVQAAPGAGGTDTLDLLERVLEVAVGQLDDLGRRVEDLGDGLVLGVVCLGQREAGDRKLELALGVDFGAQVLLLRVLFGLNTGECLRPRRIRKWAPRPKIDDNGLGSDDPRPFATSIEASQQELATRRKAWQSVRARRPNLGSVSGILGRSTARYARSAQSSAKRASAASTSSTSSMSKSS
jgi:hypothetical protein